MRYINTILIILFLLFIHSLVAISEQMTINGEYLPTDNKFDILIVEVNNINMNAASASLNVTEIIRTNIDKSYWDKLYRNSGYKNSIIIGYWSRDLRQDKKSQLLNLEGKKNNNIW